eukprot:747367-Hanusia_phi.AAC.2
MENLLEVEQRGANRVRKLREIDAVRVERDGISEALFFESPLIHQANGGRACDAILKMSISYSLMTESPAEKLKDTSIRRSMLENNELLGIMANDIWRISPVLLFAQSEMLMIRQKRVKEDFDAAAAARWNQALHQIPHSLDPPQFSANCTEAVVAAVALGETGTLRFRRYDVESDQGVDVAMDFVHKDVLPNLKNILASPSWKHMHGKDWDPISELQKIFQKKIMEEPEYKVLKEISKDNNSNQLHSCVFVYSYSISAADVQFVVGVFMSDGSMLGMGQGRSKAAARYTLSSHRYRSNFSLSSQTTSCVRCLEQDDNGHLRESFFRNRLAWQKTNSSSSFIVQAHEDTRARRKIDRFIDFKDDYDP